MAALATRLLDLFSTIAEYCEPDATCKCISIKVKHWFIFLKLYKSFIFISRDVGENNPKYCLRNKIIYRNFAKILLFKTALEHL